VSGYFLFLDSVLQLEEQLIPEWQRNVSLLSIDISFIKTES